MATVLPLQTNAMIQRITGKQKFLHRQCHFQHRYRKIPFLVCIITVFIFYYVAIRQHANKPMNFEGFNNETGTYSYIVPNIIHFIRFNKIIFSFTDIIVIRAAHVAQKPDAIYIHTDIKQFKGKYWNQLQTKWPDTYKLIRIIPTDIPLQIFNRSLSEQFKFYHASDFIRYRLLSQYGGIYLDNDVFIVKNLNKYRKYEMTVEWNPNPGQYLRNQLLIGHRDARFLSHCIETFRDYRAHSEYYNGEELPTTAVLHKHPEFIHRVIHTFGTDPGISYQLFTQKQYFWTEFDAIHLLTNDRRYMHKNNYKRILKFNEHTILQFNFTFGEMARSIYYG